MQAAGVTMTKRGKKTKVDTRGPYQRMIDREKVANDQSELSVITPEQLAKGSYRPSDEKGVGRRYQNNHDPVQRWKAGRKLTQPQVVVIDKCRALWSITENKAIQKVTATYGERMATGGSNELGIIALHDAEVDLKRITGYFKGLETWWNIFENVVRFGEPAGVAGSQMGAGGKTAQARAHIIVCFVADIIAMKERL